MQQTETGASGPEFRREREARSVAQGLDALQDEATSQ